MIAVPDAGEESLAARTWSAHETTLVSGTTSQEAGSAVHAVEKESISAKVSSLANKPFVSCHWYAIFVNILLRAGASARNEPPAFAYFEVHVGFANALSQLKTCKPKESYHAKYMIHVSLRLHRYNKQGRPCRELS